MKASLLFPAVFSPQRNNTEIKHAVLIQVLTVKFFFKTEQDTCTGHFVNKIFFISQLSAQLLQSCAAAKERSILNERFKQHIQLALKQLCYEKQTSKPQVMLLKYPLES